MALESLDLYFGDWKKREALAEAMIPLIGKLYRENNLVTHVYGRPMVNRSVLKIMRNLRYVRQAEGNEVSEFEVHPLLLAMSQLDLGPSRIDLAKLASRYMEHKNQISVEQFVRQELADLVGKKQKIIPDTQDIVLYGFGRIGRLVARLLIERTGGGEALVLKAIVLRKNTSKYDLLKRANLLRRDSVHGEFLGTIRIDEDNQCIIANGNVIRVIYADGPDQIDYEAHGINNAIVVDNTGKWRDEEGLSLHLKSKGVSKAILTAPAKGNVKNIVYGINHNTIADEDRIISAASCTTNAIVPILKVMNERYGIEHGHLETVHAYTNDQNLIDNYHKAYRRGRSAALNMVITATGAASAVAVALPELAGKLTGNAIRVPTPNVSMAILNLTLQKETETDKVNEFLRDTALHSDFQSQIDYTTNPDAVSSDFVGNRKAGIIDPQATNVTGRHCVLYVWYDNEFGYSCQVVRVLQHMAGVFYPHYPIEG